MTAAKKIHSDIIIPTTKAPRKRTPAPTQSKAVKLQQPADEIRYNSPARIPTPEQQIIAMASNPEVNVEKMRALIELNQQVKQNHAREAFAADYVRMKPDLPKIAKIHPNKQTNSKYAKLEDINRQVDPILQRHGFATATKVISQTETNITVRAELWHSAGHIESTEVVVPLDLAGIAGTVNKTKLHATASSITYGKRIAICALLNISTGDDTDGNMPTAQAELPEDKFQRLEEWIGVAGGEEAKNALLKYLKIESLNNVHVGNYMEAVNFLKQRVPKKDGGTKE